MIPLSLLKHVIDAGRRIEPASTATRGLPSLGVLQELPGVWENTEGFQGRAWNMIALPFGTPGTLGDFRLLLNQANETLHFDLVDVRVPNRGSNHNDQFISAVRYLQALNQVAATDAASDSTGTVIVPATPDDNNTPKGSVLAATSTRPHTAPVGIHQEPGIFLHLLNLTGAGGDVTAAGPDIARLASIPHGDAVLAMGQGGTAPPTAGPPNLRDPGLLATFDPFPIGVGAINPASVYLAPYFHFHAAPFLGIFDPTDPLKVLDGAIASVMPGSTVVETTTFLVDSTLNGGITNIPFVINQANATRVTAVFWIQKVKPKHGPVRFVLQYAQRVLLEFFPRIDGVPGPIQWPHISVNTMIRQLP